MSIDEIQDLAIGETVQLEEIEIVWVVKDKRASGLIITSLPRENRTDIPRSNFRTWAELEALQVHKVTCPKAT